MCIIIFSLLINAVIAVELSCFNICIHRMLWISLRYAYATATTVCREISLLRSNEKSIIASLIKFAGYIHNHKILPGNIFGLILKNKMATTGVFSTFSKDFCWPSRAKGIIGTGLKFTGYVHHYKILTGNIFGLILKNKMAATGVSLSVIKNAYISLIIGPRGLGW